ncbi:FAD-dependent monooxygenase [Microbacterium sp. NPDC058062]|uniref:FAD-dependent monooxygenase n=1 Tax=Microbacterium sp. NPDC058062 TaxID=3346320 RepID=UPI0036DF3910
MTAVRRVLIQGAGIGGLAAATAMAQRGIDVHVVEGEGRTAVAGVGLNQPQNALDALEKIGVKQACLDVGFPFEDLVMWNTNGDKVMAIPPVKGLYGFPSNNAIGRPVYYDILKSAAEAAGARITIGRTIDTMTQDADGVDVTFARWVGRHEDPEPDPDAPVERYDLVVGFDGVRSSVRNAIFGDKYTPTFSGSGIWRATIPRPDYLTEVTLVMAPGNVKAVLTPISATHMYFGLVTPEPGNPRHRPEDFVRDIRERTSSFTGRLAELRDTVSDDSIAVYTALEHVVVREPWFQGRIAIAGDAAHASPPHLSQGAAQALEDAVTLAEHLETSDDLDDALNAWYRRRHDRTYLVADMSLAILKSETGSELTESEKSLIALGAPGALVKIATEPY